MKRVRGFFLALAAGHAVLCACALSASAQSSTTAPAVAPDAAAPGAQAAPPADATPQAPAPASQATPELQRLQTTAPADAATTQTSVPAPAPTPPPVAPATGPAIELAEGAQAGSDANTGAAQDKAQPRLHIGVDATSERVLSRGLQPERMAQQGTVIGGYGQFNLTSVKTWPDGDAKTEANVDRLVLFLSHHMTDAIAVYTELEWEDALACSTCQGSAEVEQAFVDWKLAGDALALRAGLLIVPMGIVNQWHEPPVFHGVQRPATDIVIIPTTWRELGVGVAGTLAELYHYELYFTTTLDPTRLSPDGLSNARTLGSLAPAQAFALTGRFEVEPLLGVIAGAAFFFSDTGGNADFYRLNGQKRDLSVPMLGYALDARARRFGFEARALWSQFFMPESNALMHALRADGSPVFANLDETGPIATRIQGGYLELAYDVFHLLDFSQQLLAFVRLETYDTQAAVPDGYDKNPRLDVDELTTGLTYRPIAQLVFKADLQLRDRRLGYDELQLNAGLGYMF